MEYIKNEDFDYIINKYHDASSPLGQKSRWIRQDRIFDPKTGMDGDALIEGILARDALYCEEAHPVRKAKAFTFLLENTRIACDPRDLFPAINAVDRPLNKTLIALWKKEVFQGTIPEVEAERAFLEKNGIVTIWPDYDHSVPHWERLLALGFPGILAESEAARAEKDLLPEQEAFFEGIRITYQGILRFLGRLEQQALAEGSLKMAEALAALQNGAPKTFYQALLLNYVYFILCEHIEGLQVRSLSNFDRLYAPFYQADRNGGVPEEELRRELAYFFLQFTAIDNYWNQPVYLGGCRADGSTVINEFSYVFLDVYDHMGIFNPKIQIKVAENTPKELLLKALDMVRHGNNSIVFVGDATVRRALERAGATPDQARSCDIKGCYEYSIVGGVELGMNYLNLLKPLEYALNCGCDGVTGIFSGRKSPAYYASFEAFFEEYKNQLRALIDRVVNVVNAFEDYMDQVNPQSMLSATFPECLQKGRDALGGGSLMNNSGLALGFMANTADSLTMLKKYVFDQKRLTLDEFRRILKADFEGAESFRRELLADRDKYGNNKELPDGIARQIADTIATHLQGRPNAKRRGGKWVWGYHVARQSYTQADKTASSPDGRLRGVELSKNLSPYPGMNREGATAAILSVTKIDATAFPGDACLDLGLLPSAVKGEEGLLAMLALLHAFIKRGGHALQINVYDAETLRDAQKHPEKYEDLQIRVCGWNVLWNQICPEEQEGFIRQAEGLEG